MNGTEKIIIDIMQGMKGGQIVIFSFIVGAVLGAMLVFAVGGIILALEKRKK